jgi:hypothetical protein
MERQPRYELNKPVRQNLGTSQCWWLALLEVARVSGKLDLTFEDDGTIGQHFLTKLENDSKKFGPKQNSIDQQADGEPNIPLKNGNLVYGPAWQRMIMSYLQDTTPSEPWNDPNRTAVADRQATLKDLLQHLGVKGITLGKGRSIISSNVDEVVYELEEHQYLLVDKTNQTQKGATGHCMAAIAQHVPRASQSRQPKPEPNPSLAKSEAPKTTFK